MGKRLVVLFVPVCLVLGGRASGSTVTGSLSYDGEMIASVFPDVLSATILAYPYEGGDPLEGTVDLGASTYRVESLAEGTYSIQFWGDRPPQSIGIGMAGDLLSSVTVEIQDAGTDLVQDIEVHYSYHVVSPFDSTLPLEGSGTDCTAHPVAAYPITFSVEPVPRATSYTFIAQCLTCPGNDFQEVTSVPTSATSAVIQWCSGSNVYQRLYVNCTGATGIDLCGSMQYQYDDFWVWALLLRNSGAVGRGVHHSNALFVPAVASAPGYGTSYWSTSMWLVNPATADRTLTIYYTPRGQDGTNTYSEAEVTVPGMSSLAYDDVLADLFSTTGAGSLEIRGSGVVVSTRTWTAEDGGEGSYGQGIPPVSADQLLSTAGTPSASMAGVREDDAFRTNLGLCEVWGESAEVEVSVLDSSGTELGSETYSLPPFGNLQVNRLVTEVAGPSSLTEGIAVVTVTSGSGWIAAYLSIVDNSTDDPTYIPIGPQSPVGSK